MARLVAVLPSRSNLPRARYTDGVSNTDDAYGRLTRRLRKLGTPARAAHENDWSLAGRVIAFKPLRNPLSGGELFWIHLDLERIKLEVLVNQRALRGDSLTVGAMLDAEVWLQGHVLDEHALRSRYEGVDYACSRASFWSALRRQN